MALATTTDARIARVRHGAATPEDRSWLRIAERTTHWMGDGVTPAAHPVYVCDCRCRCHLSSALTATGARPGSCGLALELESLDCARGCRSSHILASECQLDETRGGAHV